MTHYSEESDSSSGRARLVVLCLSSILFVTVVFLRGMGQPWWCDCHSPVPWSWDIWSTHNSQHLLDPYFFTHLLHGVLFFGVLSYLGKSVPTQCKLVFAILLESIWEILENSSMIIERYRTATISLDYFGDSVANSVMDIVACGLGFLFASRVTWRWSVAVLVFIELALLLTIRDCLTLNVIMLVSPIEAIKQWQSG